MCDRVRQLYSIISHYEQHSIVTICITMDVNFTNGWSNQEWIEPYKYNFTFPYPDLGVIRDSHMRYLGFFFGINLGHAQNVEYVN